MTRRSLFKSLALIGLFNPIKALEKLSEPKPKWVKPEPFYSNATYFYAVKPPTARMVGDIWVMACTNNLRIWDGKEWK